MRLAGIALLLVVGTVGWLLAGRLDSPSKTVLEENFDGSEIDTSTWRIYSGETSGGNGRYRPENVSVGNGVLRIRGTYPDGGGLAHTQGQRYGRWEIRARMERGAGFGPAVLLWPDSERWPIDGEINIAEQPFGDRQRSYATVHYDEENKQLQAWRSGDFTEWHVFAVDWEPDRLRYYIDGRQIFSVTRPARAIPRGPMHLALQLDTGPLAGWIPGPDDSTPHEVSFYVDWVRVYRR